VIWERKLVGRDISPIQVDRDNHVYIAAGGMNGDRYLYAFYPDGTTKWKLKIPSPLGTKVETLYLGNDRSLYLTLLDKNSLFKISQANP
jgi:outer membrane protein assembly factor BamB